MREASKKTGIEVELVWRRESLKRVWVQDERLYGVDLSGTKVEIDVRTGSTSEPRSIPPLPPGLSMTSTDPPTLARVEQGKTSWKRAFNGRMSHLAPLDWGSQRLLKKVDLLSNMLVALFDLVKGRTKTGWSETHGSELFLLDWNTGNQIGRHKPGYSHTDSPKEPPKSYWNVDRTLALIADRTLYLYDALSARLISESRLSEHSGLQIESGDRLITILEKPLHSPGRTSVRIIDGERMETKALDISRIGSEPFELTSYKDLAIVVTGAPMDPCLIHEYIPRFFHVIDEDGNVLWNSESIPHRARCHSCGKELIDDWVLGAAKDNIIVRRGKLVAHWAFSDPYGYGMSSTSVRIFNVYTGKMLREIDNCVYPTLINGKIAYLHSLSPRLPYEVESRHRRTEAPPTEIVIEDVTDGELLRTRGSHCLGVQDQFVIQNGNEALAYR